MFPPKDPNGNDNNDDHTERRNFRFFFYTLSSLRRELSPTRSLKWSGAIVCKSRATHPVSITCNKCHLVRRDSSAVEFDRVEIAFILALFYWLKRLTDVGGEETGVPGENP